MYTFLFSMGLITEKYQICQAEYRTQNQIYLSITNSQKHTFNVYIFLSASSCHVLYARKKYVCEIEIKHVAHEKKEGMGGGLSHTLPDETKFLDICWILDSFQTFFCSLKICLAPPIPPYIPKNVILHTPMHNPIQFSIFDSFFRHLLDTRLTL